MKRVALIILALFGAAVFFSGCIAAIDQYGRPVVIAPAPAPYIYQPAAPPESEFVPSPQPEEQLVPRTFYYLDRYYGGCVVVEGMFPLGYSYPGWYTYPLYGWPIIGWVGAGWDWGRRTVIINNIRTSNYFRGRYEDFDRRVRRNFGSMQREHRDRGFSHGGKDRRPDVGRQQHDGPHKELHPGGKSQQQFRPAPGRQQQRVAPRVATPRAAPRTQQQRSSGGKQQQNQPRHP